MSEKLFEIREISKPTAADEATEETPLRKSHRRTTMCHELSTQYLYRRAFSETSLLDACGEFDFKEGHSYHFITAGDVDALSYLKAILRQQPLNYCLFSTWCMAAEDILQIEEWMQAGRIEKLDAYVGEIFPNSYKVEYQMLKELFARNEGAGRIAVFKNHSKIFAGIGPKFAFVVESSANINTNPRTENGCITIDRGLYDFYREYFDGIKSFE
jgi:hypothetical protein